MKTIIILAFSTLGVLQLSSQNTKQRLDAVYTYDSLNNWTELTKEEFTYSPTGILLMSELFNMQNNTWLPLTKKQLFYSAELLDSTLIFQWNNTSSLWENDQKTTNTFLNQNQLTEQTLYNWDPLLGEWINYKNITFTYGTSNELLETVSHLWSQNNGGWVKELKRELSYNTSIGLSNELFSTYDNISQNWVFSTNFIYSYSTLNDLSVLEKKRYDQDNLIWKDSLKTEFFYNTQGMFYHGINFYYHDSCGWEAINAIVDSSNISVGREDLILPYSNQDFLTSAIFKNQRVISYSVNWIPNVYVFAPSHLKSSFVYSEQQITTSIFEDNQNQNIKVYPNPSSGLLYFEGMIEDANIEVFDLKGNKVWSGFLNQKTDGISLEGFPNGLYIYFLKSGKQKLHQGEVILY